MSIYMLSEGAEKSLARHKFVKLGALMMCMYSGGFCVAASTFITVISSIGAEKSSSLTPFTLIFQI